jgi:hypothetical protein
MATVGQWWHDRCQKAGDEVTLRLIMPFARPVRTYLVLVLAGTRLLVVTRCTHTSSVCSASTW